MLSWCAQGVRIIMIKQLDELLEYIDVRFDGEGYSDISEAFEIANKQIQQYIDDCYVFRPRDRKGEVYYVGQVFLTEKGDKRIVKELIYNGDYWCVLDTKSYRHKSYHTEHAPSLQSLIRGIGEYCKCNTLSDEQVNEYVNLIRELVREDNV